MTKSLFSSEKKLSTFRIFCGKMWLRLPCSQKFYHHIISYKKPKKKIFSFFLRRDFVSHIYITINYIWIITKKIVHFTPFFHSNQLNILLSLLRWNMWNMACNYVRYTYLWRTWSHGLKVNAGGLLRFLIKILLSINIS